MTGSTETRLQDLYSENVRLLKADSNVNHKINNIS